jgi:transcriptional regulator with XRE-family HTH domain
LTFCLIFDILDDRGGARVKNTTLSERVKAVRKHMGMNQTDFAKLLGMAQSVLAMKEVGKSSILERHIKTIASVCGIDEHWLRTGEGEMLKHAEKSLIDQLIEKHHLGDTERVILETYVELPGEYQAMIMSFIQTLSGKLSYTTQNAAPEGGEEYINDDAQVLADIDAQVYGPAGYPGSEEEETS